jgi:hypothetical protein
MILGYGTSTFMPSLGGTSFTGVLSSPVAAFEASLFRGGMADVPIVTLVCRVWGWRSGGRKVEGSLNRRTDRHPGRDVFYITCVGCIQSDVD